MVSSQIQSSVLLHPDPQPSAWKLLPVTRPRKGKRPKKGLFILSPGKTPFSRALVRASQTSAWNPGDDKLPKPFLKIAGLCEHLTLSTYLKPLNPALLSHFPILLQLNHKCWLDPRFQTHPFGSLAFTGRVLACTQIMTKKFRFFLYL